MSNVESTPKDILSFFPLEKARPSQAAVIKEIDKVFSEGRRIVILEAPVGSGKSAIAMTFANKYKNSHIITPRKSLQDQYYADFSEDIVLMKGRNAYPCTIKAAPNEYKRIISVIQEGHIHAPMRGEANCANAPCRNNRNTASWCKSKIGDCPYNVAIEVAQAHHTVVHNIHSFIYQTNFSEKFEKRPLMVIDEAHEIEDTLRNFITQKITINTEKGEQIDLVSTNSVSDWCDYFLGFAPPETEHDLMLKANDEFYRSAKDEFIEKIESFRALSDIYGEDFSVKASPAYNSAGKVVGTEFEFIPHQLGNAAERFLFAYADRILLMSGTIYDKEQYCRYLGVNASDAYFIRVSSTFPVENRPIYAKPDYQTDTSHANWEANFEDMVEKIEKIMAIFKDVKGLIHVPSYHAGVAIAKALKSPRIVLHDSFDFAVKLEQFFATKQPYVFVSPVCQQGVDFKDDRARFQIITRVPYLNTSDPFIEKKVQEDFPWYNLKALVLFGQQIGRVNRSEKDYGATFLLDARFNKFLQRNSKKIPQWVKDAIIYK